MKSRLKVFISAFLVLCLVVLAGCQAIAGVDINQAFKNSLKVTSSVGSSSIHFKLDLNEAEVAKLDEEEKQILNLLSDVSLTFEDIKMQDANNVSMKGNFSLANELSLDFSIQMSEELAVIWVEGAKQPFSLDLTGETSQKLMQQQLMEEYGFTEEDFADVADSDLLFDEEQLVETFQEITQNVAGYIIDKLPNAEHVSIDFKKGSVNGQLADLFHVHAELDGSDLYKLIEKFVTALLADREGIESLVSQIVEAIESNQELLGLMGVNTYDAFSPEEDWFTIYEEELDAEQYEQLLELIEEDSVDPSSTQAIEEEDVLDPASAQAVEEEDFVGVIVDEIMNGLQSLSDELANFKTDEEYKDIYEAIFGDSLKLTVDLHIDQKLQVRKSAIEIAYTLTDKLKEESEFAAINGFTLTLANAANDINEKVVSDKPIVTEETVSIESLAYLEDYEAIQYFEEGSWLHSTFLEYADLTQAYWKFDDEIENPLFLHNGSITMVPLREVIEEFRGEIEYNAETKELIVFDKVTDSIIELQVGSSEVKVNGEVLNWPVPVEVIDGTTYVPARALADALGATIYWEDFDGVKCLNIEREL